MAGFAADATANCPNAGVDSVAAAMRRSRGRKSSFAQKRVWHFIERSPAVEISPREAVAPLCWVIAQKCCWRRKRKLRIAIKDGSVAHPARVCGNNNNGAERGATCKKATAGNRRRHPILHLSIAETP